MKRKFLEDFGIEKETIDKIMAENESDIHAVKAEQMGGVPMERVG